MSQVTTYGWNVGAQQQQQVCATISDVFFSFTQFLITFICVSKKFKRRGTRRQLPERSYGPESNADRLKDIELIMKV